VPYVVDTDRTVFRHDPLVACAKSFLALAIAFSSGHAAQGATKDIKTSTGKWISVIETHPVGQSVSDIRITTAGFEHELDETVEGADPIKDIFIADLDGNGFDELYIITISAGSGSYGKVIGMASNREKSMSMINFPEIERDDPIFEGYMGHDAFTVENQRLVRSFPVYRSKDTNTKPTGGTRRVVYRLKPGEAMWQLQIERAAPDD
jgi:hypothetical protein